MSTSAPDDIAVVTPRLAATVARLHEAFDLPVEQVLAVVLSCWAQVRAGDRYDGSLVAVEALARHRIEQLKAVPEQGSPIPPLHCPNCNAGLVIDLTRTHAARCESCGTTLTLGHWD